MATPTTGVAFITVTSLEDQANAGLMKANPTLAAGDVKVSIDGGNEANIATLPTAINSTALVKVSLSASEMDGDYIAVIFVDAAGAEWYDRTLVIHTETDVYHADVWMSDDDGNTSDLYAVRWFKNGVPVANADISSANINVIKAADGTDLVANTALTETGTTLLTYTEATNRITGGLVYQAIVTATIDGATRTWSQYVSRDS